MLQRLTITFFLITLSQLSLAHEFWIEPEEYQIRSGRDLNANIRIGEYFSGDTHAFFPNRFGRFELITNNGTVSVQSRLGDRPAVQQRVTGNSLLTILYDSRYSKLTYDDPELFQDFLELEGIEWVLDAHRDRGLPDAGFSEVYRRFSKTLVAVGNGRGDDQHRGMMFEWVLQQNPYQESNESTLTAQLFWQGQPMTGATARLFIRQHDNVDSFRLKTDSNGMVELPRRTDAEYLLNAVHMIEPSPELAEASDAVWESLWASMVFLVGP